MTTAIITNERELNQFFADVQHDFEAIDYVPVLQQELELMADLHDRFWGTNTGPDGSVWPPLAPSTVQRKGFSRILVETGALEASLTSRGKPPNSIRDIVENNHGAEAFFGTYVPYSGYHDTATAHRPARVHVGLTDQFVDRSAEHAVDYALEQLRKGA